VWKRPGLAPRDRSLITVAALVARNQTAEMAFHMNLALDLGTEGVRWLDEVVDWGEVPAEAVVL
jgi:hypothetical protein